MMAPVANLKTFQVDVIGRRLYELTMQLMCGKEDRLDDA